MFLYFKFLLILTLIFGSAQSLAANSNAARLKSPGQCNPEQMREAMLFISDYLGCISGTDHDCVSVMDAARTGLVFTSAVGVARKSYYSSQRVISMANSILDSKKFAKDSYYSRTMAQQLGGKDVYDLLAKHNGDSNKAIAAIDEELKALSDKKLTPAQVQNVEDLQARQKKIQNRVRVQGENQRVLQEVLETTDRMNNKFLDQVFEIDQKMAGIDNRLNAGNLSPAEKSQLQQELKALKSQKKAVLANVQTIQTHVQPLADSYNQQLHNKIKNLDARAEGNLSLQRRVNESVNEIKRNYVNPKAVANSDIPRLVMQIDEKGLHVADINSKFSQLPKWAKELRISQVREFPQTIARAVSNNPGIETRAFGEFLEKVSEEEHERYRVFTRERMIKNYEGKRILAAKEGITLPDLQFTSESKFTPGAEMTKAQQNAILQLKSNFLKVDVPYSQLSVDDVAKTRNEVFQNISDRLVTLKDAEDSEKLGRLTQLLIKRPGLARALATGVKVGGAAVTGGLLWFDAYPMFDLGYSLAYQTDYAKENWWAWLDPQCRMPREQALGAPNAIGEVSKRFCACEKTDRRVDQLNVLCKVPPTEMSEETKEYCTVARSSGRDRDLLITKKFMEGQPKDPKLQQVLRDAVGCEVMKNHPSHCRWTTDQLTDQGLYFMALIQQHKLYEPVSKLCPDVCQHWVDVANQKIKEIPKLEKVAALPETPKDNKAKKSCHDAFTKGPPPTNFHERISWGQCQPPIICEAPGKIRVRVDAGKFDYYQVSYNPESREVSAVDHYLSETYNQQDKHGRTTQEVKTKSTFEYRFNEDGVLEKIQVRNFETGKISESIPTGEIFSRLGEAAYNANASQNRDIGEWAINKRLEILMLTKKSIKYCCQHENHCSPETDGDSPITPPKVGNK